MLMLLGVLIIENNLIHQTITLLGKLRRDTTLKTNPVKKRADLFCGRKEGAFPYRSGAKFFP